MAPPRATVAMLAYGPEPVLGSAVRAVLDSVGVDVDIVLVDNGCTTDAVDRLPRDSRVRLVRPARNLGFTGGVNLALSLAASDVFVLVNSDAIVAPGAIHALVAALEDTSIGIVSGCVRLADDPMRVNSVGNPLHVLGLSWAGGMGELVADHMTPGPIASATGALLAVRRSVWDELGGFPEEYFAYLEDLELSWRCWQSGHSVQYVPTAVADHYYEFGRSPLKMYLVERNRLIFLATCHQVRTLALLALPLVAFEFAIAFVAARQGWLRQKLKGWWWCARHVGVIRRRRVLIQASRTVSDRDLAHLMTDVFDPAQFSLPVGGGAAQAVMHAYWRLVEKRV